MKIIIVESIGGNYYIGQTNENPLYFGGVYELFKAVHIATPNRVNAGVEVIDSLKIMLASWHLPSEDMKKYYMEVIEIEENKND